MSAQAANAIRLGASGHKTFKRKPVAQTGHVSGSGRSGGYPVTSRGAKRALGRAVGWRTKSLEPLVRFARGDVRDYIV